MFDKDEKPNCPWYIYKTESLTELQVWFGILIKP